MLHMQLEDFVSGGGGVCGVESVTKSCQLYMEVITELRWAFLNFSLRGEHIAEKQFYL